MIFKIYGQAYDLVSDMSATAFTDIKIVEGTAVPIIRIIADKGRVSFGRFSTEEGEIFAEMKSENCVPIVISYLEDDQQIFEIMPVLSKGAGALGLSVDDQEICKLSWGALVDGERAVSDNEGAVLLSGKTFKEILSDKQRDLVSEREACWGTLRDGADLKGVVDQMMTLTERLSEIEEC